MLDIWFNSDVTSLDTESHFGKIAFFFLLQYGSRNTEIRILWLGLLFCRMYINRKNYRHPTWILKYLMTEQWEHASHCGHIDSCWLSQLEQKSKLLPEQIRPQDSTKRCNSDLLEEVSFSWVSGQWGWQSEWENQVELARRTLEFHSCKYLHYNLIDTTNIPISCVTKLLRSQKNHIV